MSEPVTNLQGFEPDPAYKEEFTRRFMNKNVTLLLLHQFEAWIIEWTYTRFGLKAPEAVNFYFHSAAKELRGADLFSGVVHIAAYAGLPGPLEKIRRGGLGYYQIGKYYFCGDGDGQMYYVEQLPEIKDEGHPTLPLPGY